MSLVGDVLSHIALPGIGLGLLYGVNVSLGALASLVLGIMLIWWLSLKTELSMESLVGVVFVLSLAVGFPSHSRGGIIACSFWKYFCRRLSGCGCGRICKHNCFYSGQNDLFKNDAGLCVRGFGVGRRGENKQIQFDIFIFDSRRGGFRIKVGGTLLTAMIIIPAAVARNVSRNMRQYSWLSIIVGATSAVAGFAVFPFLAERFNLSAVTIGPVIILASIAFFAVSLFV